jgi:hypothetical protein
MMGASKRWGNPVEPLSRSLNKFLAARREASEAFRKAYYGCQHRAEEGALRWLIWPNRGA